MIGQGNTRYKEMVKRWGLGIILLHQPILAFAHGGGLDANGGHHDRKNGGYHCHRAPCGQVNQAVTPKTTIPSLVPMKEYNRDDWKHWSDADGDCMNTRHETLLEQADGDVNLSPDGCYVSTGTWIDPFSGKTFHRASDLDVDHVVPLKWAHDHGGANWSEKAKERFANDPLNLLVVDDGLNQSKGAQGPTEWMPPNQAYRCEYLHQWQKVLGRYSTLQMLPNEVRVFNKQINVCKG